MNELLLLTLQTPYHASGIDLPEPPREDLFQASDARIINCDHWRFNVVQKLSEDDPHDAFRPQKSTANHSFRASCVIPPEYEPPQSKRLVP